MIGSAQADDSLPSKDRLSDVIIESLGDGVLIVDCRGLVHRYNKRFVELWGIDPLPSGIQDSVLLAQMVKNQLLDPEAFMKQTEDFAALEDGREHVQMLEFCDGRTIERRQRSLHDQGLNLGRLVVFRDVTEQRKAEESNNLLTKQVQATQRLESLGVLAGGLAHEFNNILMAILGNADLLVSEVDRSSEGQIHLSEIRTASRRAADLCSQMLTYAGKGEFRRKKLDLVGVVREMRGILDVTLGKEVVMNCDFEPNLPEVLGDLAQMRQLVLNLVGNAADACLVCNGGQVDLQLFARHCSRSFLDSCLSGKNAEPGPYVCLEVSDTGCGLDMEQQSRVFDPFFTTKFVGRGLGLSAVLGIARGHGGVVCLKSRLGKGSAFSVFLPVAN
jgi:signal transduction histidine kinase